VLHVSTRFLAAGRAVEITGSGFPPGTTVRLTMRGPDNPKLSRNFPVSTSGTFRLVRFGPFVGQTTRSSSVGAYYAGPFLPGSWSLTATGASVSAHAAFTVTQARLGFSAAQIAAAYNFTPLYRLGYQGQGEQVAIVVASSTPTLSQDVAVFSNANHLPPAYVHVLYAAGNPGYLPA
jgi:hypothetical protein